MTRTRFGRRLAFGAFLGLIGPVVAFAGPVGPPNAPPYDPSTVILNSSSTVQNKTFSVPKATISTMTAVTVNAQIVTVGGVPISTNIVSGTSVYPATATIVAGKGVLATTMSVTGMINGTSVTITGLFDGATIHGSSLVITGTITGSNVHGTNSGDVTIGNGTGLSITGQILALATATTSNPGALSASDWNTFTAKLSTTGNGSSLTGLTKSQVGLGSVQNVNQTDADNLSSGMVDPTLLGIHTPTGSTILYGDSTWQAINSTSVGLGSVTNDKQVKISNYTQKSAILVGTSTGVFSVMSAGNDGTILSADSSQAVGYRWVISPTSFSVYPATATASFLKGWTASTGTLSGALLGAGATFTGDVTALRIVASSGVFSGTLSASNLSGTNTGDAGVDYTNGLSIAGQVISLASASATQNGALTTTDWQRFNTATSTSGVSFSNIHITSATATQFALQTGTLGSSVIASSIAVGAVGPAQTSAGTFSTVSIPAANVNAGSLGASVLASSVAANAVLDASVVSVSASKITGTATLPSAAIDGSSITKQGNTFNGNTQLVQTTGAGALPALSATNLTSIPAANITGTLSISSGTITTLTASTVTVSTVVLRSGLTWKNGYTQRYSLIYNVKDYGAVGDGVTSCDAAFTAAYAAAKTNQGAMYIPAGTYQTATTLTGSTMTAIIGDGSRQSIVNYTGSSFWILNTNTGAVQTWFTMKHLQINNTAGSYGGAIRWGDPNTVSFSENDQHINFFFEDLLITGNRNTPVSGSRGIQLTTFIHTNINDVFVYGYETDYDLKKFDQSFIKHSLASDFSQYGIYLHNDAGDYVSDETTFIQTTLGNSITGSTSVYVASAQNLRFYDTYCDAANGTVFTCLKLNSVQNGTFDGATINSATTLFNFANVRNFVIKRVGLQNPDQSPAPLSTTTFNYGSTTDLTGTNGPFRTPNYGLISVEDCAFQVALSFQGQFGVAIKSSGKYGGTSFFNGMASDLMGLYATQILDRNANGTSAIKETSAVFGVNGANKYLAGSNYQNTQIVSDTNTPTGLALKIPASAAGAVFMDIPYSDITAGSYEFNARLRSTATLSGAFLAVYYDNGSLKENFGSVNFRSTYTLVNFRFNFSPAIANSTVSIRMDTSQDLYIDYAYVRPCFNSQIIQKYVSPDIQKIGSDTPPGFRITFSTPTAIPSCSLGDITYSTGPTAGGTVGWACVTTGTPGTWKTFGTLSP